MGKYRNFKFGMEVDDNSPSIWITNHHKGSTHVTWRNSGLGKILLWHADCR